MTTVMASRGQTQPTKLAANRYVPLAKATESRNSALLRQRPTSTVEHKPPMLRFVNITNLDQCKSHSNRKLVRSIASKSSGRPSDAHKAKATRLRAPKSRPCGSLTGTYSSDGGDQPFVKVKQKAPAEKCLPVTSLDKFESEKLLPLMALEKFGAASCDPFRVYPSHYTSLDVSLVSSCTYFLRLLPSTASTRCIRPFLLSPILH